MFDWLNYRWHLLCRLCLEFGCFINLSLFLVKFLLMITGWFELCIEYWLLICNFRLHFSFVLFKKKTYRKTWRIRENLKLRNFLSLFFCLFPHKLPWKNNPFGILIKRNNFFDDDFFCLSERCDWNEKWMFIFGYKFVFWELRRKTTYAQKKINEQKLILFPFIHLLFRGWK